MARFLIIDDHPLFREALHSIIRMAYPDCEICEASSMAEANLHLKASTEFDLALLDLKIPDATGFEGLLQLRTRFPYLPVVVVSGHEDPHIVKSVLSYGTSGFIPKSAKKDYLTKAIRKVMRGEIVTPDDYQEPPGDDADKSSERIDIIRKISKLTKQQMRVMHLIHQGLLNKQIAYELDVGETTIKAHVSEILKKLCVNNRTQAAMEMSKLRSQDFEELNGAFDSSG